MATTRLPPRFQLAKMVQNTDGQYRPKQATICCNRLIMNDLQHTHNPLIHRLSALLSAVPPAVHRAPGPCGCPGVDCVRDCVPHLGLSVVPISSRMAGGRREAPATRRHPGSTAGTLWAQCRLSRSRPGGEGQCADAHQRHPHPGHGAGAGRLIVAAMLIRCGMIWWLTRCRAPWVRGPCPQHASILPQAHRWEEWFPRTRRCRQPGRSW